MNIGICDDLLEDRACLKALLLSHAPSFTIFEYPSGEDLLAGLACGDALDLLFLDIYMGDLNGIDTAETLRKTHKNLPIIFLTTAPDFALSAFGVRAIGYLLKPVNQTKLAEYLQDFTPPEEPSDTWLVTSGQTALSLDLAQIVYWEQRGNYGEVHMEDGSIYPVRKTFAEVTSQLGAYANMSPCGRALFLNLRFVRTLNRQEVILTDGTKLPVPRRTYQAFREAYLNFYKGGGTEC